MKQKLKLIIMIAFVNLCLLNSTIATTNETIPTGSFIINMGVTPQTENNALKPYGLIYAILNLKVGTEIKWVINTTKAKDGIDFSHNGVDYRSGAFIIPAQYRTTAVNALITAWTSSSGNNGNNGVIGATTVSSFTAPVYTTLLSAPRWTLDFKNGSIAAAHFVKAGIPTSAHGGASSNWKLPSQLGACDDIFVMPHADPTWATHNNLFLWNRNFRGNIWAGCHAVNFLESMTGTTSNTDNPANTAVQLNFLTTGGLINHKVHANATPPFTHRLPSNPVAQYMGISDQAHTDGSEQDYLPSASTSSWRNGTFRIVVDPSHPDRTTTEGSNTVDAINVWGRAFDDNTRGLVMYQGGHDIGTKGNTLSHNIAAVRSFFNFSFLAAEDRRNNFNISVPQPINVTGGRTFNNVSATITTSQSSTYTYLWSSPCSEVTFSSPTAATTNITVQNVTQDKVCTFNLRVEDACGRVEVKTYFVNMFSRILPPTATNTYFETRNINIPIFIPALQASGTNASITSFRITSLPNSSQGTLQLCNPTCTNVTLNQVITYADRSKLKYIPNNDFVGTSTFTYTATDANSLTSLPANYTINTTNYQPVAQNTALPTVSNTVSTLIPLKGFDADGIITDFKVTSPLPNPTTEGTLTYCSDAPTNSVCNVPLSANTTITYEQAQTLRFNPVNTYTGTISIPFIAIDNDDNQSATANFVLWVNTIDEIFTAPIADNIIASPISNSAARTTIPPLRGGNLNLGDITSFTITELPNASHGILYFCKSTCVPLTVGQVIPYSDAGFLEFDPNSSFVGDALFKYTASNASNQVSSVATYELPIINEPPLAHNITYGTITTNSTARTILPSLSGLDEDGTITKFKITKLPNGGILYLCNPTCNAITLNQEILIADASKIAFTPNTNFVGTSVFEYTSIDNNNNSSQFASYGIVTKPLSSTELAPLAINISVSTNSFTPVVIIPALTATLPVGSSNAISNYRISSLPSAGEGQLRLCATPPSTGCNAVTLGQTISIADASKLVFNPNADFIGISNFNYFAVDNQSNVSNIATVSASVSNIAPMAKDIIQQSIVNTSGPTRLDFPLLATDGDGSIARYTIMSIPTPDQGLLRLCTSPPNTGCTNVTQNMSLTPTQISSRQLVFTPNSSYNGYVFFGYSATDNSNNVSNPALVTIMTGSLSVLPVHFVSFDVVKQNNTALIKWTTAMEDNISYFEIERSFDGINFVKIGKMDAVGSEYSATNYQFVDHQPSKGLNYYRIQSIEFNKNQSLSPTKSVFFDDAIVDNGINVYPNPFDGILNINSTEVIETLEITDFTGKSLIKQNVLQNSVQINTSDLQSGIYYLRINDKVVKILKY
jgi:hypothetical protein